MERARVVFGSILVSCGRGAHCIDGAAFRRRFLFSEIAGFGLGLPAAAAYALIMVTLRPGVVAPVLRFVAAVAVAIVLFVALSIILTLAGSYRKRLDRIGTREIDRDESMPLFLGLMSLPMRHGICLFARVAGARSSAAST